MKAKRQQQAVEELSEAPLADPRKVLPSGWVWTTVETVGDVTLGRQRSPKDHDGPDMRPYLRVANVYEDWIDTTDVKSMNFSPEEFTRFQLRHGDLLLNEGQSKELVGRAAIFREEVPNACFQNTLVRFRCLSIVHPVYALTIFRCYLHTGEFRRIARWTTNIAHLGAQRFAEMNFPLAPLAEQQRIVEATESYVTRLDDAVATLDRVERNLKRYRASVLKSAVEGRLVPTEAALAKQEGRDYEPASALLERILTERRRRWGESGKKGKYQDPTPPDTINLPDLPEGWCWSTIGQLTSMVKDGPHYSPKYAIDGIPFITGGNVRPEGVDFDSAKRISRELHTELSQRVCPQIGDILYTKGGTTGIARVNTYNFEFNVWVHVAVLRLVGDLHPFYIQHALNSPWCYAQAQRFTHGVGNQDLGLTRMINITVPLPPLGEQSRIIAEVDRIQSVVVAASTVIDSSTRHCQRLRQSILKWAFEGKLADQDPNDESASALLERIKAERDDGKPAAPARSTRDVAKKKLRA